MEDQDSIVPDDSVAYTAGELSDILESDILTAIGAEGAELTNENKRKILYQIGRTLDCIRFVLPSKT